MEQPGLHDAALYDDKSRFLLIFHRDSRGSLKEYKVAMPNERDRLDTALTGDESSGWMASLLAEEDAFDRRVLWRLGTWAGCAVGLLTVAVLASQSSTVPRRERTAFAEMTRQAQQIQWIAKESQDETRRLAAAVDTLNGDRDRLYSRVTVLEQGLDSVTGSINKQPGALPSLTPSSASPPPVAAPAAVTDPVPPPEKKSAAKPEQKPETAAIPLTPSAKPTPPKVQAKADASADPKPASEPDVKTVASEKKDAPLVTAAVTALPDSREAAASQPAQRTDFGVDIGTANSVEGLRALWRGALAAQGPIIGGLQPIIVVKERTDGFGLQLRLVAGPIANAAEAAKVCARLVANKHGCETSVYDGQRLAMNDSATPAPVVRAPKQPRRSHTRAEETQPAQHGFTSIFGR